MKQYLEHVAQDQTDGAERRADFLEAVGMVRDYSKLAAMDAAYQKALELDDEAIQYPHRVKNIVDAMAASIIQVRDQLADER